MWVNSKVILYNLVVNVMLAYLSLLSKTKNYEGFQKYEEFQKKTYVFVLFSSLLFLNFVRSVWLEIVYNLIIDYNTCNDYEDYLTHSWLYKMYINSSSNYLIAQPNHCT